MATREQVLAAVNAAIDELNEELAHGSRVVKSEETVLFGEAGVLDSIGLVSLIVAVEQNITDQLGATVALADEKALSQARSPFRTVASLTDYVQRLLEAS